MFCLCTSAVECTHQSLMEELWLRDHRSPHQEQQLLKYNRKGRTTQNTAEQSTVKKAMHSKSLNFLPVSRFTPFHCQCHAIVYLRIACLMTVRGPKHYIISPYILHYIQLHYNSHCIYNTYTLEDSSTHTHVHTGT